MRITDQREACVYLSALAEMLESLERRGGAVILTDEEARSLAEAARELIAPSPAVLFMPMPLRPRVR